MVHFMEYMQKKILYTFTIALALFFSSHYAFAQSLSFVGAEEECLTLTTPLLRVGSRDISTVGEVTQLQKFLVKQGFLSGEPTGYYGRLTFSAVKAYQNTKGITPTGNVGPLTRAFIEKQTCKSASSSQSSVVPPTTQPTPNPSATVPVAITPPQATTQTITFYKANKASNTCMATTMVTTLSGAYVYKTDEYTSEADCLKSFSTETVAICTMEYRSCPDGTPMKRDPNCTWRADTCPVVNRVTSTSVITSLTLMRDTKTNTMVVRVTGSNLGDFNKLEYNSPSGITGYLEQGLLSQNGTVRDIPADSYLSTASFSTFQARIVASDGSKGAWLTALVSR